MSSSNPHPSPLPLVSPGALTGACEALREALATRPDGEEVTTVFERDGWTLALAAFPAAGDPSRIFLETWLTHPTGVTVSRCALADAREAVLAALADPATLGPRLLARLLDDLDAAEAHAVGLIGEGLDWEG